MKAKILKILFQSKEYSMMEYTLMKKKNWMIIIVQISKYHRRRKKRAMRNKIKSKILAMSFRTIS